MQVRIFGHPRARTLSAMAGAPAQLEHPGLLPSLLVLREDGSASRSTRDWLVDTAAFLLALGIAPRSRSPRPSSPRRRAPRAGRLSLHAEGAPALGLLHPWPACAMSAAPE
jgi:hypothetical protein